MNSATFTDLLRHPNDVVAQVDEGAVRISRRDASDLILMRAGDYDAQYEGVALASQIMRALLRHNGNTRQALAELYSWVSVLSTNGQQDFAAEIDSLIWPATELGTYGELLSVFRSWRGTAEALSSGIAQQPIEWIPAQERRDIERP